MHAHQTSRYRNLRRGFLATAFCLLLTGLTGSGRGDPVSRPSTCLYTGFEGADDPIPCVEWRNDLRVVITEPSDGFTIWINQTVIVSANVVNSLQYSNDGGSTWYDYSTGTPTPIPLWPIVWSDNIGGYFDDPGSNTTFYTAPGYTGPDPQSFVITATASQTPPVGVYMGNIQPEDVTPGKLNGDKKAVTLEADQKNEKHSKDIRIGDENHPYDWGKKDETLPKGDALPAKDGGGQLGWVRPGHPEGCEAYAGCTYVHATNNDDVPLKSAWYQTKQIDTQKTYADGTIEKKTTKERIDGKIQPRSLNGGPYGDGYVYCDQFRLGDAPGYYIVGREAQFAGLTEYSETQHLCTNKVSLDDPKAPGGSGYNPRNPTFCLKRANGKSNMCSF